MRDTGTHPDPSHSTLQPRELGPTTPSSVPSMAPAKSRSAWAHAAANPASKSLEAHVLGTRGQSGASMGHPGARMWHWRLPGTHQAGGVEGCPVGGQLGFVVLRCWCVSMSVRCAHVPACAMVWVPMSLFPQSTYLPVSPRVPVSTHGDVVDMISASPCLFLSLSVSWSQLVSWSLRPFLSCCCCQYLFRPQPSSLSCSCSQSLSLFLS